jgi:WD40 repeat protein
MTPQTRPGVARLLPLAVLASPAAIAIASAGSARQQLALTVRPQVVSPARTDQPRRFGGCSREPDARAFSICFSPDGTLLAAGRGDGAVGIWDRRTRRWVRVLAAHTDFVKALCFTKDGKTLISGSQDGTTRFWDVRTGTLQRSVQSTGNCLAISPDGRLLAIASVGTVTLWSLAAGKKVQHWQAHGDNVASVAFSPDGRSLATGGSDEDFSAHIWDVATAKMKQDLRGVSDFRSGVWSLAFAPSGRVLASGGNRACLWSARTGRLLKMLQHEPVGNWSVAFSPDGRFLATGTEHDGVQVRDTRTWAIRAALPARGREVFSLAFSRDGHTLAAGTGALLPDGNTGVGDVRLWDVRTWKLLKTLTVPASRPSAGVRARGYAWPGGASVP